MKVDVDDIRWFHYSSAPMYRSMVRDGRIRRSSPARLASPGSAYGRAAVWFSCREDFEPTACQPLRVTGPGEIRATTLEERLAVGPLIRLQVPSDVCPHDWAHFARTSGADPRIADVMRETASELGSDPDDYRFSFHDVPLAKVIRVEVSTDGRTWQPTDARDGSIRLT